MNLKILLSSIGSTESSSFGEICQALNEMGEKPSDRTEWSEFFKKLDFAEHQGWLEIDRIKGQISSAQLTEDGVAYLKTL